MSSEAAVLSGRLSTVPTQCGEFAVMRLLYRGGNPHTLDIVGTPPTMFERFRAHRYCPNCLVW